MYHDYTPEDINQLKSFLEEAFKELWLSDNTLFSIFINDEEEDRKLHEVCINHRLAVYLERYAPRFGLYKYFVDIEYNRYYDQQKGARRTLREAEIIVRPDICIHKRTDKEAELQHYLVVEAKKDNITAHDIDKIERLLMDDRYRYKFGLSVSYLSNPTYFACTIYYYDKKDPTKVQTMPFNLPK